MILRMNKEVESVERRIKMKGFIEVTGILNDLRLKTSINVNQIISITELEGKIAMTLVGWNEPIVPEESYEEIKAKIAEAVG